jgi:hypothetical protein
MKRGAIRGIDGTLTQSFGYDATSRLRSVASAAGRSSSKHESDAPEEVGSQALHAFDDLALKSLIFLSQFQGISAEEARFRRVLGCGEAPKAIRSRLGVVMQDR